MSDAKDIDSLIADSEEKMNNFNKVPLEDEKTKKSSNEEDPETRTSEIVEDSRNFSERRIENSNSETRKMEETTKREVIEDIPTSPTTKNLEINKAGECNLLPVLVEQLRSALEQSCSSQSSSEERNVPTEDSGVDSEEDLRVWASGLCNSMEEEQQRQQQQQQNEQQQLRLDDSQSHRGLKLDLKFLEDLLLSDIQTALGRLQETLIRVDIGTLARYSSSLDPTNKLNLLKLISSLLANLKIPEESMIKPDKSSKSATGVTRRRRTDRHTIGVSSEELARARKWLQDKNVTSNTIEPTIDADASRMEISHGRNLDNFNGREKGENANKEDPVDRLDSNCRDNQYEKLPEKYMKDALNQQQSLQNKNSKDTTCDYRESSINNQSNGPKITEVLCKDDDTIINEEYGITASSLYHQSNVQAKCNKFLAKKSKIKRANTIDIPNYLKLRDESLANGHHGGSLRRPINIGDRYSCNVGNVIPSFEPKTENDRKFLALINKNNDNASVAATSTGLPFKSFNYRPAATVADKNWNNRFSNIKTTFDKPITASSRDENNARDANDSRIKSRIAERDDFVQGSPRLSYKAHEEKSAGFSHAPTSPFRKIEKAVNDETTMNSGFLKSGYLPKNSGILKAKVKLFDQENVDASSTLSPLPTRSRGKQQFNARRSSNVFLEADDQSMSDCSGDKTRVTENGRLNYHSFCKQFAPFATKNPTEDHRSNPWSNGIVNSSNRTNFDKAIREKFQSRENNVTAKFIDDKNRDVNKVPVAYQTGDHYERNNDRTEKSRNRKFYDNYHDLGNDNDKTNDRDVVAYPFEINYHKRPAFDKKYRDVKSEKNDYDNSEDSSGRSRRRSPSMSSLSSLLPSMINSSPPSRGISSMQSVAVQTHRTEPIRTINNSENSSNFLSRDETERRNVQVPTTIKETSNLTRRNDPYRRSSSQRDSDQPQLVSHRVNNPLQGHQTLPQNSATSHASHSANYLKSQYYPSIENKNNNSLEICSQVDKPTPPRIPIRANPPSQKGISSILKNNKQREDYRAFYDERSYDDIENHDIITDYPRYDNIFYRDNQNPIYVPPNREIEREKFHDDSSFDRSLDSLVTPPITPYNQIDDNYNNEESKFYGEDAESENHSFNENENIENQDISSTEGVVTRYVCAIATVSPVPESPILSPVSPSPSSPPPEISSLPPPVPSPLPAYHQLEDTRESVSSKVDENSQSSQRARDNQVSYVGGPIYRDEDNSLEQIRRHNLLQQNLIRQLHGERTGVSNIARRLSEEKMSSLDETRSGDNDTCKLRNDRSLIPKLSRLPQDVSYRNDVTSSNFNNPIKSNTDQRTIGSKVSRKVSQERPYADEITSNDFVYPPKLSEDQNVEPIIESNNTQDKINIFEGRSTTTKKHQHRFKPLSVPRNETDKFVPPKINIVSPSKVFEPSFKVDSKSGSIGNVKLPQKSLKNVDSSDEYLMSCANKPSRSIVLSKSESWHQLALSKSTLRVPQAQPSGLLKPPKPKSPSSVKLSKQYEASSSSDAIRKMEDKIQRYFQGSSSSSSQQSDLPVSSVKKDSKTRRNFNSHKASPGPLVRSQTMPHIYDETTDVEKAFDSLFKEATRSDVRY